MGAGGKAWTSREVLALVRAVLAVRDAGLMRRMQHVWGGRDSATLSPLSRFFQDQADWFDLFGFGHDAFESFWQPLAAALRDGAPPAERRALMRRVDAILQRAEGVAVERAQVRPALRDKEKQGWLRRQLAGLDDGDPGIVGGSPS